MKQVALAVAVCLLLASCQGGFSYHGTVASSSGAALEDCSIALKHDGETWQQPRAVRPPTLDGYFSTAPFEGVYQLVISCAGHRPHEVAVHYGSRVTPAKDLDLGDIVLEPQR